MKKMSIGKLLVVLVFITFIIQLSMIFQNYGNNIFMSFNSIKNASLQTQVPLGRILSSTLRNKVNSTVSRVVVSLTSFSSRLAYIDDTLVSIFHQTFPFDQIYLCIPIQNYTRYNISTLSSMNITAIQQKYAREKLTVIKSVDYGPSTKLLGVLQIEKNPETIIITIDDDIIYHPKAIEHLVSALINLTTNSSVAAVCETVFKQNEKWQWQGSYMSNSFCKHGFLAGYGGATYRRKYFDESIFDYRNVSQGCILHDDVYISGYLNRKGIYPYIISPFNGKDNYPWSVIKHNNPTDLTVHKTKDVYKKQLDCIKHFNYFQ